MDFRHAMNLIRKIKHKEVVPEWVIQQAQSYCVKLDKCKNFHCHAALMKRILGVENFVQNKVKKSQDEYEQKVWQIVLDYCQSAKLLRRLEELEEVTK